MKSLAEWLAFIAIIALGAVMFNEFLNVLAQ